MRRRLFLGAMLVLAACSGDDGDGSVSGVSDASTGNDGATSGEGTEETSASTDPTIDPTIDPTMTSSGDTTSGGTTSGVSTNSGSSTTGPETGGATTTSTSGGQDELPPVDDADALLVWLEEGSYLDWDAESAVHPSSGPHGDVRTYLNATLVTSLTVDNPEHPPGSAAVKELYTAGELTGYAVTVKTSAGGSGDTWYWYEILSGSVVADGNGVLGCTGCHSGGTDHVLTPFPLQ